MDMTEQPGGIDGPPPAPADLLDRMARAVEKVRNRLLRATKALDATGVPYAVVGEQAVAAWVASADEAAVRYSPQIDVLLSRCDMEAAGSALAAAGFAFRQFRGMDAFIEGDGAKARDAIRVVYAGEGPHDAQPFRAPDIDESARGKEFQLIALEPLVKMKLESFRLIDRVNLRDVIDVGLVGESWLARLPAPLAERLKELLDNPEG